MASVALLGAFLLMLSVVVMARSMSETNFVAGDRAFDQAIHVAESSIDLALASFTSDPTLNTGQAHEAVDTHDEVLAAALAIAHDPASPYYSTMVTETGEGLSIIIKPFNADVLYGVGITPSLEVYDAGAGKARIIVSELGLPYWTPQQAVLVGGPAKIEAQKNLKDIEMSCGTLPDCTDGGGWIHTNGEIEWKNDKNIDNIHGCLTAYGNPDTVFKANGDDRKDPSKLSGTYTNNNDEAYPYCPDLAEKDGPPSTTQHITDGINKKIPFIPVPEVDPMAVHYLAQYEVCHDGIRWGPNGDGLGDPYKPVAASPYWVAGATKSVEGTPCTGDFIVNPVYNGWVLGVKNGDKWDKPGSENWANKVEFDKFTADGIYFLWGRSVKIRKVKEIGDVDRHWTIIASHGPARMKAAPNDLVTNDLTCMNKDDLQVWNPKDSKWEDIRKEHYGDIEIEVENTDFVPYGWTGNPDEPGVGKGYLAVTAGDVKIKIKGKKDLPDPGDLHGIIAVHEQFRIESNDADEGKGAIFGAVIAEDACDTKDSLHRDKISEFKKGDIIYNGQFQSTDFLIKGVANGEYRILTEEEF